MSQKRKSFMLVALFYLLTILGCQNSHDPAHPTAGKAILWNVNEGKLDFIV